MAEHAGDGGRRSYKRRGKAQSCCASKNKKSSKGTSMKYILCAICGAKVEKRSATQILCGSAECKKEHLRRQRREQNYMRNIYAERKKPAPEQTPPPRKLRASSELFELSGKSLNRVALEAKVVGMSYGKYCVACSAGRIEHELAKLGISRERAQLMVQQEQRRLAAAKKAKKARAF